VGGVNVFLWHVHGSWTTSFVQGRHDYFVPVVPDRGPDGRGRAQTWEWPASVHEVSMEEARDLPVDALVLQREEELVELAPRWLGGRRPGADVPTVYVEHNCPQGRINELRHPAADRDDLLVVHVSAFNALFWDTGKTATAIVEHGVVDPGYRYTGELARAAVVVNEPARRDRVVGADLVGRFDDAVPVDVYGMESEAIGGFGDVRQDVLHTELGRRRTYLHPYRWTSLGLSLLEAMHVGMPVVALATTATAEAVPPQAGVVSNRLEVLEDALRTFHADRDFARAVGSAGRAHALEAFGLDRFLADWDRLLAEVVR
jgi:hypothetical protein